MGFFLGAASCFGVDYREAPMLRDQVERGELPPVEERLPDEPLLVEVIDEVGVYGGEIRTITPVATWLVEELYMMREPLIRFASDGVTIVPNLLDSWELAEDAESVVLRLRSGLRWSDGAPVTTEDVLFAWNDVLLNKDITPVPPPNFVVDGKPMVVEVLDANRFRLVFDRPYGSILYALIQTVNESSLVLPKHYLRRYHPSYTPLEKLEEMAAEHGFDHWFELFRDVNHTVRLLSGQTPSDYPTLSVWSKHPSPGM